MAMSSIIKYCSFDVGVADSDALVCLPRQRPLFYVDTERIEPLISTCNKPILRNN